MTHVVAAILGALYGYLIARGIVDGRHWMLVTGIVLFACTMWWTVFVL